MAESTKPKTFTKEQDGTIKLTITVPQADIKKATNTVIEDTVKNADLKGFRKGKAPRKLVEETINQDKLREEVLRTVLPPLYMKAVSENNIRPVMNPKIHVEKMEEGKDWTITAITCEMPEIKLGKYKDAVKKITAKSKIVLPGKEDKPQEPNMDEILKAVMENTKATIPSILVQQEADRLLSQMFDEIKKLGLTLDQYMQSTGKKPEDLRNDYEAKATSDMTLEFALQKIAEEEKLQVEEKDINDAINAANDPQEKASMEQNRYLLASILRQRKTLDFLKNL